MRIAIAGISHETNTYCEGQTSYDAFYTYRGAKMLSTRGQESDVGGAIDACERLGCEPLPILFASTQPSGVIERTAYDDLKDEIINGLAELESVDGCVLLLHGAGVVDGIEDLELDLTKAVRTQLGAVPIAASFDLHGNISQGMADQLNGLFGCHHYPHIDLHERAAEAVQCVYDMHTTGVETCCSVVTLPMLLPTTTTFEGIGQEMLARLLELEQQGQLRDLSWFHGFPYTDVAHVGNFVSTTYVKGEEFKLSVANTFANELWARREEFRPVSLTGEQAVKAALAEDTFPVVIHETSDNCGAGAPGDGTHLLGAMLEAGLGGDACFAFLVDPEVAVLAHKAGVGATVDVLLGGKTDDLHGESLHVQGYVKALHDGRVVMQHMFKGAPLNLGPLARLVIEGMDVVVSSRRNQTFDQEPFLAVGIDVMKYKYIALKSSNHFRAGFQQIASAIVTADTPGLSTHDISVFPRQKTSRALWPIHDQASFPE